MNDLEASLGITLYYMYQGKFQPYVIPGFLVKKPDGSLHFWVNYQQLNKVTIGNRFPLTQLDDLVDTYQTAR